LVCRLCGSRQEMVWPVGMDEKNAECGHCGNMTAEVELSRG